jgi:membrane associated rhomboid family serine protease
LIPIRDTIPSKRFPFVTIVIIGANVIIFLFQLTLGNFLNQFIYLFGLTPAYVLNDLHNHMYFSAALPFISSMFLHGGWVHLLGNMIYLWIFGDNIEDKLGHGRFILFYLLCGIGAAVGQIAANPLSFVPMVGASGAIAGILGGYILLFPRSRVVTLVPIFFFFYFIEIPAILFLGLWFLMQFFYGTLTLAAETSVSRSGVAWWAHVGGFITGAGLVFPFRKYR